MMLPQHHGGSILVKRNNERRIYRRRQRLRDEGLVAGSCALPHAELQVLQYMGTQLQCPIKLARVPFGKTD